MTDYFEKIKNRLKAHQDIGYVSVSNIAGNAIGALFWFILAIFVTTHDYGKISYYLTIGNFVSIIVLFGLPTFLTTFAAKGFSRLHGETVAILTVFTVVGATVVFLLFHNLATSLFIVGASFYALSMADLIGNARFRNYAIFYVGQKACSLILSLGLYFVMGFDGVVYGFCISFFIFSYKTLYDLKYLRFSFTLIKEKRKFLFHSWSLDLSKSIGFSIDKFMIAPLFGFATLGLYNLGIQILMLQAIISNMLFSYLLREQAAGFNRKGLKMLGIGITISSSVIVWIFSPYVIPILFPKFIGSIELIRIATWAAPFLMFNTIFSSKLLGSEKSKPVAIAAISFAVILYILMYYLGKLIGPVGLVEGLVSAVAAETIVLYLYNRREDNATNNSNSARNKII